MGVCPDVLLLRTTLTWGAESGAVQTASAQSRSAQLGSVCVGQPSGEGWVGPTCTITESEIFDLPDFDMSKIFPRNAFGP